MMFGRRRRTRKRMENGFPCNCPSLERSGEESKRSDGGFPGQKLKKKVGSLVESGRRCRGVQ